MVTVLFCVLLITIRRVFPLAKIDWVDMLMAGFVALIMDVLIISLAVIVIGETLWNSQSLP